MSVIAVKTLADLKQEIADDLERDDLTESIEKEIKAAIRHFEEERFWFSEDLSSVFLTTPDDPDYDAIDFPELPQFSKIEGLVVVVNGSPIALTRIIAKEMLLKAERSGVPREYSITNEVLTLNPTPDQAYTVKAVGFRRLDELSDDSDTNAWLEEAFDLIRARAGVKVSAFKLRDMEAATAFQTLEDRELTQLRAKTEARRSSGNTIKGMGL